MKKTVQEGIKKKIRYIKESIMKERERENWFLWIFSRDC
jgi:hypothetical protein